MGPNALWLLESLADELVLEPGQRVLDLGCGKAMTSIFLAREFGVEVVAADLWIDAAENAERIEAAGVSELVTAVHAEAHALPFEPESFDAVVSIDAYQYFGTDDLYIGSLVHYLRPGGRIGIVVPSLSREIGSDVPPHLAPYWEWEFCCFHSPAWWRAHWEKTGLVTVDVADWIDDGWRDWLHFTEVCQPHLSGWRAEAAEGEQAMLRADRGELLGFTRMVGTRA